MYPKKNISENKYGDPISFPVPVVIVSGSFLTPKMW